MSTLRIPKNPTKRWAWIIYQLALRDTNLACIAKELGVTRQAVCRAARGPRPRMERAIADKLQTSPCRLWPERYPECGSTCAHHSEQAGAAQ